VNAVVDGVNLQIEEDEECPTLNPNTVPIELGESDETANGARLKVIGELGDGVECRVVVLGDFICEPGDGYEFNDEDRQVPKPGKALDGDHLPPWVPEKSSGNGIQGGTFESWFTLEQDVY
jgi:hypothetical protein